MIGGAQRLCPGQHRSAEVAAAKHSDEAAPLHHRQRVDVAVQKAFRCVQGAGVELDPLGPSNVTTNRVMGAHLRREGRVLAGEGRVPELVEVRREESQDQVVTTEEADNSSVGVDDRECGHGMLGQRLGSLVEGGVRRYRRWDERDAEDLSAHSWNTRR